MVADIDVADAKSLAQAPGKDGHNALVVATDVSREEDTDRMATETVARFGRTNGPVCPEVH